MFRKLGIYINQMGSNFDAFTEDVKSAGFDYICTQDSQEWFNLKGSERERIIKRTREKIESLGLKNLAHHSNPILFPLDKDQKEAIRYQTRIIEEIKDWGISFWVLHNRAIKEDPSPWKSLESVGKEKFDELVRLVLKEVCQYASQYKISIALENIPFPYVKRISDIMEVIEGLSEPNLGICFDSGHCNISGLSLQEEMLLAGGKLLTTHFHDNFGNPENEAIDSTNISKYDLHLMPGLGTINWVELNRILNKINYKNPVAFEGIRGMEGKDLLGTTVKMWRTFENLSLKR
jgi:sugar phosphate isomerase/epimerase